MRRKKYTGEHNESNKAAHKSLFENKFTSTEKAGQ